MKLTFLDSNVLISAVRGAPATASRARDVLDDPRRSFASSPYVCLEVLPKALFHRSHSEKAFYEGFFERVRHWASPGAPLLRDALAIASRSGLSALDALHVAAAIAVGADELITTEKPTKPIHRVTGLPLKIVSLAPVLPRLP